MQSNSWKQKNKCDKCGKSKKHHKKEKHRCRGCVCDQLRRLQPQTEVDVFLLGGQVLEDVDFITLDQKNCCAFFKDEETEPGSTLIVDCRKIQAIRIEAD